MKIHPDVIGVQSVQAYGQGWVQVAGQRIANSLVMASSGERFAWNCSHFTELTAEHFAQLAALETEIVIFGSGEKLRFPAPHLTHALIEKQIGLESMDTQAACRTYNILAGEGRHVALALLLEN
jgi:uncharacterized protein